MAIFDMQCEFSISPGLPERETNTYIFKTRWFARDNMWVEIFSPGRLKAQTLGELGLSLNIPAGLQSTTSGLP